MNRVAVLSLVKQDGSLSRLEGWAGDIKFVVRRLDGRNDRWALMVTPPRAERPPPDNKVPKASKADRAAEAARDLLRRLGDPVLDDGLEGMFP